MQVSKCQFVKVQMTNWYLPSWGFPGNSVGKESFCDTGDLGSVPGLGRTPGDGNGKPPCYSCLENPMDREAWQATVYGVAGVGHNLATEPPPPSTSIRIKS